MVLRIKTGRLGLRKAENPLNLGELCFRTLFALFVGLFGASSLTLESCTRLTTFLGELRALVVRLGFAAFVELSELSSASPPHLYPDFNPSRPMKICNTLAIKGYQRKKTRFETHYKIKAFH